MKTNRFHSQRRKGSASAIVLILLFLMVTYAMTTSVALSNLQKEMHGVEAQQMKKYAKPSAANAGKPNL